METEDERRARLEIDAATKRLRLVMEAEDERSAKEWNGLDLDLIWI